jgi:SAM-dependent methyltransferase
LPRENGLTARSRNLDPATVRGFGEEWTAYDQTALGEAEYSALFNGYFAIFPFDELPPAAEGFDLGCGSGRWAAGVLPRVGILHCIDPSEQALAVARRRLAGQIGVRFHAAAVDAIPLADASQDFGYSLGVLHHVPDTVAALRDCTAKLKAGAPFLLYLYYRFDGRPAWFVFLWRASDVLRRIVSRLPILLRKPISTAVAALVYWPLARVARVAERLNIEVPHLPLRSYRFSSFYTMRSDALDRFGTRLEKRFTRAEIEAMMKRAGLVDLVFSNNEPFWVACGRKAR